MRRSQQQSQFNSQIGRVVFITRGSTWAFWGSERELQWQHKPSLARVLSPLCSMKPIQFPIPHILFSHWDIIETNLRHLNIGSRVLLLSLFIPFSRCRCSAEPTCIYIHEEPRCSQLSARQTRQLIIPKSSRRAHGAPTASITNQPGQVGRGPAGQPCTLTWHRCALFLCPSRC